VEPVTRFWRRDVCILTRRDVLSADTFWSNEFTRNSLVKLGCQMCNLIGHAIQLALTRRGFIAGSAVSLFAPVMSSAVAGDGSIDTRIQVAQLSGDASKSRTRLILLGTSGGPTWYPNSDQSGISSVVAVGDAYYIVDCGEGVGKRLQQAISPTSSQVLNDTVRALFLTHLHSDHTADYANLLFFGLFVGLDRRTTRFKVFGPGRRGQMAPIFSLPGAPTPTVPIIRATCIKRLRRI
jgi:hypothetical protein